MSTSRLRAETFHTGIDKFSAQMPNGHSIPVRGTSATLEDMADDRGHLHQVLCQWRNITCVAAHTRRVPLDDTAGTPVFRCLGGQVASLFVMYILTVLSLPA